MLEINGKSARLPFVSAEGPRPSALDLASVHYLAPARGQIAEWTDKLVSDCRGLLSAVLPLTPDEAEFIRRLNDTGDIAPDLLTGDATVQANIQNYPGLRWKAVNVKKHFGASDDGTT